MASNRPKEDLALHIVDYLVFIVMFAFTMAIGIRYAVKGRMSNSRESYFVGNRKMHFIPVAFSLMVTFESSIKMLGLPTEVYLYGTSVLIVGLSQLVTHLLTVRIAVPLFKSLKITSSFEYIQMRFGSRVIRLFGVGLSIISTFFYMGVVLYAQAVALEAVMGLNMWISILVMAFCAVVYTSLGGIKSVVWTDLFQAVIMFGGIFAIIIKGTMDVGGLGKVWEHASDGGRLKLLVLDTDPTIRHSVWTAFLPTMIGEIGFFFSQSTVQRVSASRSEKEAKHMIYLASVLYLLIYVLTVVEGIVIYAYFSQRENEPISCGFINNPNMIVPYAVMIMFKNIPGMAGLFMASLYSASLSTLSSGLSSMSVLVSKDLLQFLVKTDSDEMATFRAKISVVFLGAICVGCCVVVSSVQGPFTQVVLSLLASFSGPMAAIFILACFFPSTHKKGVVVAVIVGCILSTVLTMGATFSPNVKKTKFLPLGKDNATCVAGTSNTNWTTRAYPSATTPSVTMGYSRTPIVDIPPPDSEEDYNKLFSISYVMFKTIAIGITTLTGIVASYVMGRNRPGDVNPKHTLEITEAFFFFLPASVRKWIKSIGLQYKQECKEPKVTSVQVKLLEDIKDTPPNTKV